MRKTIARSVVLGTAIASVAALGVASAAWSVSGTSTGANNAASRHVAALGVTMTLPTDVYPTDSFSQNLTVSNSNPFNVSLDTVAVAPVSSTNPATLASSTPGCQTAISNLTQSQQTGLVSVANNFPNGTTAISIARQTGLNATTGTYPVTVTVSNDLPNACQDATLTVNFTVSGSSSN